MCVHVSVMSHVNHLPDPRTYLVFSMDRQPRDPIPEENRHTDRRTYRHTDSRTDRRTDGWTHRQTDRHTDKQADRT